MSRTGTSQQCEDKVFCCSRECEILAEFGTEHANFSGVKQIEILSQSVA
jgi:hypothetical protein